MALARQFAIMVCNYWGDRINYWVHCCLGDFKMKYKVVIKMKKPYMAVYTVKPDVDLAIEGFADSLLNKDIDEILQVEIVEIKGRR